MKEAFEDKISPRSASATFQFKIQALSWQVEI